MSRIVVGGLAAALAVVALGTPVMAREITHAMGTTEVPDQPQRVVVLTNEGTEALLALGVTPVGAVRSWLGDPWYDHIAPQMADVVVLGQESAVNLEVLVSLEPDLILGTKMRHEEIYEQLSAIAPTVISERLRGDWQVNFTLYSEAVGKAEEGKAALAAFESRVGTLGAELGEQLDQEISLGRFMSGKTRLVFKDTFAGLILDKLGFKRPAVQDKDEFTEDVTKELIPEFEGDRLFYFIYDTGDGKAQQQADEWMSDPLWQNLEVVKAGKAEAVSDAVWNTAGGIIAANLMLDDIERLFNVSPTR